MAVIIYHGNGLVAMSKTLSLLKSKYEPMAISEFNGKNQSFEQVLMGVGTNDLFAESRLIVLENFTEKTDISNLSTDEKTTVVMRINRSLPVASVLLKTAKEIKAQIQEFSEADEVSIFPFLDSLGEKKQLAFSQFEKVYSEYGGQYIFTMLYYFYRRMIIVPKKTPTFALQKLEKQKNNFPQKRISELYELTLETDFQIKSGLIEERIGITLVINEILKN
jgi:DNA polymerase III delta subunit